MPVGNRFLVYVMYPKINVSVRIHWGPQRKFVSVFARHSIFNRTCKVNIGELMSISAEAVMPAQALRHSRWKPRTRI